MAVLTVLGFAARLAGFDQSLFADELSTYASATLADGPGEVIDLVRADDELIDTGRYVIELTPPAYFVLAWLGAQIGDPTETVRLPSLLAGTAAIPLVYVLGTRTVGRSAALVGTALAALSPFLVYYSQEARAYALGMLVVLVSTLALLRALETRRLGWWTAYAVASCAAVYTHYTVAFVLLAQAGWVLWAHRSAWRPLIAANLAATVGFVPWLSEFLDDGSSPWNVLGALHPFGLENAARDVVEWSVGDPLVGPSVVPGLAGGILIVSGLLIAIGAVGIATYRGWAARSLPRPGAGLVLVLALAASCPVGMIVWSALGDDILYGRNLIASTPGLVLAIGALLTAPPPRLRAVTTTLVVAGVGVGLVTTFDQATRRPDYKAAAAFVESRTEPEDLVIDLEILNAVEGPLSKHLSIYLEDREIVRSGEIAETATTVRDGRFAIVSWVPEALFGVPVEDQAPPDLPDRFSEVDARGFPGTVNLSARVFEDERTP